MQCDADDVNVMAVSMYTNMFDGYSLTQFGPVQANLKVYNSTVFNVIGSCVLYHHIHKWTQALPFNIMT